MLNQMYLRKDLFENISNVICVEMVRVKEKSFILAKVKHIQWLYLCHFYDWHFPRVFKFYRKRACWNSIFMDIKWLWLLLQDTIYLQYFVSFFWYTGIVLFVIDIDYYEFTYHL